MNQRNINSTVKKASIHLRSVIDGEQTEHDYFGEYRFKDNSHIVAYRDYAGNAVTMVGIEANETMMLIHRVGCFTSDMLFNPESETLVKYDTLSLKADFILTTKRYDISEGENGLKIQVEYALNDDTSEPEIKGKQKISITFTEDTEDEKVI